MIQKIINHAEKAVDWSSQYKAYGYHCKSKRLVMPLVFLAMTALFFSISSCKKLVNVEAPNTQITSDNVYSNDATAIAVLNGLYSKLSSTSYISGNASISNISLWAGLSADEFTLWSNTTVTSLKQYYQNELGALTSGREFWNNTYPLIYGCNAAIEGLNKSSSLSVAVKQQLLGEAKFLRAYFYFYLVNLYGDVPLVLTTDYTDNSLISRSQKSAVYDQIRLDLKEAKDFLSDGYLKNDATTLYTPTSAERIRPSKAAASAMLARVALYSMDWNKAESEASLVMSNTVLYDTVPLNMVFNKNNKETIWQIQPVSNIITNTYEGNFFNLSIAPTGLNSTHFVYLSQSLLNSFEAGDKRKVNGNWINVFTDASGTYYYPYKYKVGATAAPVTEYPMLLRLGELYLIRAEARAHLNNLSGAIADLDIIRKRAGLSLLINNSPNISQTALIDTILHERRVELFTESGNRWFDLKRNGAIDKVMTTATGLKGGVWHSYQQLYPIPGEERLKNPNLTQNDSY